MQLPSMSFFHVQHSQNQFCSRSLAAYALIFPKNDLTNWRKLSHFIIGVQETWKFSIITDVNNERGIQWTGRRYVLLIVFYQKFATNNNKFQAASMAFLSSVTTTKRKFFNKLKARPQSFCLQKVKERNMMPMLWPQWV